MLGVFQKKSKLVKFSEEAEDIFLNLYSGKRRKRRKLIDFIKYFSLGFCSALLIFGLLAAWQAFGFWRVYQIASVGKNNLLNALDLVKKEQYVAASSQAQEALKNFSLSEARLEKVGNNFLFMRIPGWGDQVGSLEVLFSGAQAVSDVLYKASSLAAEIKKQTGKSATGKLASYTDEERTKILAAIFNSSSDLEKAKIELQESLASLKKVEAVGFLYPIKSSLSQIIVDLEKVVNISNQAIPLLQLLPQISGFPEEATYLLMLQNNDELRPTGGFLGTFGIIKVGNGEITDLNTHDVYHLDMPAGKRLAISPPAPLSQYLNKNWYLRDANWSPDWPTSAKQIIYLYEQENALLPEKDRFIQNKEFDGVIAITPQIITDLLKFTGPISIEGEEYNSENFTKLLEYRVEKGYVDLGVPSWHRKEVIGEIALKLKEDLFNTPIEKWPEIFNIISRNLDNKDVLMYFENPETQKQVSFLGWSGEIKESSSDYFMVVDANLGAFKTDAVMNKKISYKLTEKADGYYATLRVDYSHNGGYDWRTTTYRDYTRVYVPTGSKLLSVTEFPGGAAARSIKADISEEVFSINNKKSVFGVFSETDPGKINSLVFEYKLSDQALAPNQAYSLLVQKQPGSNIESLVIDLSFNNEIKSYSPPGLSVQRGRPNTIYWKSDLLTDRQYRVEFK
jgi:hypothetical protein